MGWAVLNDNKTVTAELIAGTPFAHIVAAQLHYLSRAPLLPPLLGRLPRRHRVRHKLAIIIVVF